MGLPDWIHGGMYYVETRSLDRTRRRFVLLQNDAGLRRRRDEVIGKVRKRGLELGRPAMISCREGQSCAGWWRWLACLSFFILCRVHTGRSCQMKLEAISTREVGASANLAAESVLRPGSARRKCVEMPDAPSGPGPLLRIPTSWTCGTAHPQAAIIIPKYREASGKLGAADRDLCPHYPIFRPAPALLQALILPRDSSSPNSCTPTHRHARQLCRQDGGTHPPAL